MLKESSRCKTINPIVRMPTTLQSASTQQLISRKINPIPIVERLFGKRHWAMEWVVGLCQSDLHFLLHLIEQTTDYPHFMCLARLAWLEQGDDDIANQALFIRTNNKKKIVKLLYPNHADGLPGILLKLTGNPMTKLNYRRMLHLWKDENSRKFMCNIKNIRACDFYLLKLFKFFPKPFQSIGVIRCVKNEEDMRILLAVIAILRRANIEVTQKEIDSATKGMTNIKQLAKWLVGKIKKRPFPAPPWEGNENIKPIRSAEELTEAASKFRNCAKSYRADIVVGLSYFYVCTQPLALIEIKNDILYGWVIREIQGVKNEEISTTEQHKIAKEFWGNGFFFSLINDMKLYHQSVNIDLILL